MKRTSFALFVLLALILSACAARSSGPVVDSEQTPTADAVATQVSIMLTQMPTFTPVPDEPPTATLSPIETEPPSTATPTLEPTAQPTATETPVPTATTASGDPRSYLGEPSWRTSFDSGQAFGKIENENTRIRVEDGALVLTGVNANGWTGWSMTFSQQPKDFYLEAAFTTQDCSGGDQYGLVFRAPNTSAGYFFGVTCDGRYFLDANDYNDNGFESVLIPLASAAGFMDGPNRSNRLGVMAKGSQISLYANGALLQEITDGSFTDSGYFGAFVAAHQTAGFTVRMEEIALWNLP